MADEIQHRTETPPKIPMAQTLIPKKSTTIMSSLSQSSTSEAKSEHFESQPMLHMPEQLQGRWKWDEDKMIKPELSYYRPELVVYSMDNAKGSIALFEPHQEIIGMTEDPLISNSEDSFSIEISTSLSFNICIGVAAMQFDGT